MRCRRALAAAAVLVLAAGCSGDDAADSTTTTDARPTSTSSSETTTPPPTAAPVATADTTPPTSEPGTTTSTTETAPPTTTEPTSASTVDPNDRVANTLAIIETVERSFEIYNAALGDPFDDSKVAALETVYTPRLVEGWMNIIDDYRENDYRAVPNPDVPASYEVDVNSVEVNLGNGTGSVQVCHLNTFIKVQVGGNADGSDRVVEDEVTERVEQLELIREDGRWRINAARLPDESEVVTPCG